MTMARTYITEKQLGREYWYFAIVHAANMINQVPGRLGRKLTTPFETVHNKKPDSKTWFELFSVGYFDHTTDNAEKGSKTEDQTLDGIAVGRDDKSNTIIVYIYLPTATTAHQLFDWMKAAAQSQTFPNPYNMMEGLRAASFATVLTPARSPSHLAQG